MTNYPPADTGRAWHAADYPGSRIDPNVGVVHTTEGTTLPDYQGGATAPNYTAVPDFDGTRLVWFAHFPDEMSARALQNKPGGVETNTLNALQVELVGTCDPATAGRWRKAGVQDFIYWPEAPQWALEDLAEFVAWVAKVHEVKVTGPAAGFLAYPKSYGQSSVRFTPQEWSDYYGWCGHQHVPENDHGDPGALNWWDVSAIARQHMDDGDNDDPTPMVIDVSKVRAAFQAFLEGGPQAIGDGTRVNVRRLQRALNARYRAGLTLSGVVDLRTSVAWKRHEKITKGTGRPGVPDWKSIRRLASPRYTLTPEA